MSDAKIHSLLSLTLLTAPIATHATPLSAATSPTELSSNRASMRKMKHLLASTPTLRPMGTYVGELQEKWQFPSDHLPIGMTLGDIHFASWNVLDSNYMDWVTEKNSQGLSRSMLADEHIYIEGTGLTVRDQHVVDLILEMTNHPTHPKQLINLQECSDPFMAELAKQLPPHFTVIAAEGNAVVIDQRKFIVQKAHSVKGLFHDEPERTIQEVTLYPIDGTQTEPLRIINCHIPGDPTKPARYEFARYLAESFDPSATTIAAGDMNFNELEMSDALQQAFGPTAETPSLHTPYCTNISPVIFHSKAIDHMVVHSKKKPILHTFEEVMIGLTHTAQLLND